MASTELPFVSLSCYTGIVHTRIGKAAKRWKIANPPECRNRAKATKNRQKKFEKKSHHRRVAGEKHANKEESWQKLRNVTEM
ncbi:MULTISPECIES: hypothetical protein [Bifidobacterium]|jgi:hypothetical protein|uniref:hypothetical protein n=1 Tax=Bifidobacterium TaxID=1678 RepID=UPI0022E57D9E|nr:MULTISPECIES: hypothetical protein [Bifidobacterium]